MTVNIFEYISDQISTYENKTTPNGNFWNVVLKLGTVLGFMTFFLSFVLNNGIILPEKKCCKNMSKYRNSAAVLKSNLAHKQKNQSVILLKNYKHKMDKQH